MVRTALLALALALGGGGPHFGVLLDLVSAGGHFGPGATAKAGNSADPNGGPAATSDAGGSYDPDGATATSDAGNGADPNG